MAWRFKVSKYKNAAPKFPKREESILDVPVGTLMQSCGNHIAASSTYMAFNTDSGGVGNLGVLPLETTGRIGQSLPTLRGHTDFVTDMQFSPFNDELLATCSADCTVKVWLLCEPEHLSEHLTSLSPHINLPTLKKRGENVLWNPVADNILALTSGPSLKLFDVERGSELYDISCHTDQIQSVCWRGNGSVLATSCKGEQIRVIDPRSSTVVQEAHCFDTNKDSRVAWLGDTEMIVTTGFSSSRDRLCKLWDTRNLTSSLFTQTLSNSTGTLMPLLDEDTSMLLLVGKGDTAWTYLEVSENKLVLNSTERMEKAVQIKGACLIPKRSVSVMEGEVNRLLVLTRDSIIPLPYIVPRKQYKDFHADLFPDTKSGNAALTSSQWQAGENGMVELMSLDPNQKFRQKEVQDKKQNTKPKEDKLASSTSDGATNKQIANTTNNTTRPQVKEDSNPEPDTVQVREPSKAYKSFATLHQSKCKYLKGKTLHNSTHITNIRKLDRTLPGQSNLFYANTKRCAVPLEGAGGLVSILEFNKPGRLPDTGVPVLQNGSKVNDIAFDPFDDNKVLIGCDNARVISWQIPEGGLTETLTEYQSCLLSHTEKVYLIRFHPLAKDVLLTCGYDMKIKVFNLDGNTEELEITDHTDEIFCAEWSPDGKFIATACKDGKLRIFDPRKSGDAIKVGTGPEGSRGARIVWTNNMNFLCVSGFNRRSTRTLSVYRVSDLSTPLHTVELSVMPSILIPEYDEGTSTVFLTGRGDECVLAFEVSDEFPHLFQLSSIKAEGVHQGISLLPASECDVRRVEIAKLWRLTQSSVEPISVTVPRVKPEYFQDDLFPDAIKWGVPALTSHEWFRGVDKSPIRVSLKPAHMTPLSQAPEEAPKAKKYDSYNAETYKTDDMKKEELINAVTNKLGMKGDPLPQDEAEGVDSDEWGDD